GNVSSAYRMPARLSAASANSMATSSVRSTVVASVNHRSPRPVRMRIEGARTAATMRDPRCRTCPPLGSDISTVPDGARPGRAARPPGTGRDRVNGWADSYAVDSYAEFVVLAGSGVDAPSAVSEPDAAASA